MSFRAEFLRSICRADEPFEIEPDQEQKVEMRIAISQLERLLMRTYRQQSITNVCDFCHKSQSSRNVYCHKNKLRTPSQLLGCFEK